MTTARQTIKLESFIGKQQLSVMRSNCRGEEGRRFKAMIVSLKDKLATMPKTYDQDGKGDEAVAHLHYFSSGSDWYITERDQEDEQLQAFGFACLNGDADNAELGYIPITELIECGVDFDLYFTPRTIGEIKKRLGIQ